jgi:hypothetical protein
VTGTATVREESSVTHFKVEAKPSGRGSGATMSAGRPILVTVSALDSANSVVRTYAGTITFSSSDPHASVPTDYSFTLADAGKHTFTLTLRTAGPHTLTVRDTANATVTGTVKVRVTAGRGLGPGETWSQEACVGGVSDFRRVDRR